MRLKQGTVSILIGCHNVIHSLVVLAAWYKLYGRWPKLWQVVCIFLHDIGHIGLDYLDDYEQKKRHWELGARIGRALFGQKAFSFIAGHCTESGYPLSALYKADKYSWYIAPRWWLYWNCLAEPKMARELPINEAIVLFQDMVRKSIETGEFRETHSMYLDTAPAQKQ